jgi:hypothetical protein
MFDTVVTLVNAVGLSLVSCYGREGRQAVSKARVSVFVVAGMIMVSMASPAGALPLAAFWEMNEDSGPMLDSSGNNNSGTPKNVVQGVKEDIDGDGQDESTYSFNGLTTPASRVEVPDADSLDPKANDITLTARVRVGVDNTHQMDDDSYDVVRKGFVDTPGGDYKMEIKRVKADPTIGKLHCFFKGDTGSTVNKVANLDVVDASWHTLQCVKTGTSVKAMVDGRPSTKTGSAGSIDNASDVWVGAKTVTLTRRGVERGDDVFEGSMDFVSIEIAQ